MHINLTNTILATVAILGVVSAVVTFIYRRGKSEQQLSDELASTRIILSELKNAIEKQTQVYEKQAEKTDLRFDAVDKRVDTLDIRMTIAETEIKYLKPSS